MAVASGHSGEVVDALRFGLGLGLGLGLALGSGVSVRVRVRVRVMVRHTGEVVYDEYDPVCSWAQHSEP